MSNIDVIFLDDDEEEENPSNEEYPRFSMEIIEGNPLNLSYIKNFDHFSQNNLIKNASFQLSSTLTSFSNKQCGVLRSASLNAINNNLVCEISESEIKDNQQQKVEEVFQNGNILDDGSSSKITKYRRFNSVHEQDIYERIIKPASAQASLNVPSVNPQFKQFSNSYKVACIPKSKVVTEDDLLCQFVCTYQNCGKCLKNNVTFMWHIWAHVVQQKPTDESEEVTNKQICEAEKRSKMKGSKVQDEDEEKTDVKRLHTCPKCLLVQPTPHKVNLHYHRVHNNSDLSSSSNSLCICNICEQVIGIKDMVNHIKRHYPFGDKKLMDIPYPCRFNTGSKHCKYRFSTRMALIEHFCRQHINTFVLLCPFCLQTFNVPVVARKKSRVYFEDYVKHVLCHDTEKTFFCRMCASRFNTSTNEKYKTHIQQHSINSDKKWQEWTQSTKEIKDIKMAKSLASCKDLILQSCLECSTEFKSYKKHFTIKKRWICSNCSFKTYCKKDFYQHKILSSCNFSNIVRRPYGRIKSPSMKIKMFICHSCKLFSSISNQELIEHLSTCNGSKTFTPKLNNEIIEDELKEAALFGKINLNKKESDKYGSNNMIKVLDDKETIKEQFSKFLTISRFNNLQMKPLMVKYLLDNNDDNHDEQDKEMKRIRLAIRDIK